jgi:hypothetical protein
MHGEYFRMVHAIQICIDEVIYVQCMQCVCTYVNESKSYTSIICGVSVLVHKVPIVILDKHPKKVTMLRKED